MTDKELKKKFKKLVLILAIFFIVIITLLGYTLGSKKANLSVYTSSDAEINMTALGINEDEFYSYLSIAGFCINENSKLELATYFIDNMCSQNATDDNGNGEKQYDKTLINDVLKEFCGEFIKSKLKDDDYYKYEEQSDSYVQIKELEKIPYCLDIEEISKKDDDIEVIYKLALMTSNQMANFENEKKEELEIHTVKATIMSNTDYKYSKYFISNIEEVN